MKKIIFLFILIPLSLFSTPKLTESAKLSLLTCEPGDQLYSLFGHTAIRVHDPLIGIDVVYNYGTFDFQTENFYLKYIKGLLPYTLSRVSFNNFYAAYKYENRTVYEQVLNLSPKEVQTVFEKLEINHQPQNREYLYNFLYDNCTTRSRDIIEQSLPSQIHWKLANHHYSFWDLLDQYLKYAPWPQWGIHTILGQPGDKEATPYQYMFLPDYLLHGLDSAHYNHQPLVKQKDIIYQADRDRLAPSWISAPYTVFALIVIAVSCLVFFFYHTKLFNTVSTLLFVITGGIGVLIVFLGFFTLHPITFPNWNILWANPINLLLPIFTLRAHIPVFVKYYMILYVISLASAIFLWYFLLPAVSLASLSIIAALMAVTFFNILIKK